MAFSFRPKTPTAQDDFDILWNNELVGSLWWKRNHPKPNDKVAVVRNVHGDVAVRPNERLAQEWLLQTAVSLSEPWALAFLEQIKKEKGIKE